MTTRVQTHLRRLLPKNAIAAHHRNQPVIDDATQSFGATGKAKQSGNLSTIGCTSCPLS
jgi:dTDP-4-amino-4,6-dideoxygalactose transaminase